MNATRSLMSRTAGLRGFYSMIEMRQLSSSGSMMTSYNVRTEEEFKERVSR